MTKVELNKYSINENGQTMATFILRMPRIILPEITRHRMFSFSVASSRAIPTKRMLSDLKEGKGFTPSTWRRNGKGMSPSEYLDSGTARKATLAWEYAKEVMIGIVEEMEKFEVSKEQVNRLIEPFLYIDMVLSGTDFNNYFELRCERSAQEEIRELAVEMERLYKITEPTLLKKGEFHIPMLLEDEDNLSLEQKIFSSTARCARASYSNFYGKKNFEDDKRLYTQLVSSKHFSPLEHIAISSDKNEKSGNLNGWKQWRHIYETFKFEEEKES